MTTCEHPNPPEPYYSQNGIEIYLGDCRDILPTLEPESVDLVLTDPPYNVSVKGGVLTKLKFRHNGQNAGRSDFGEWDYGFVPGDFMPEFERVLTGKGQLYVFSSDRLVPTWYQLAEPLFDRCQILGWNKPDPLPMIRQRQWCSATEYIIWAARGKYTFHYRGHLAMASWQVQQAPKNNRIHPTQKPLALITKYIAVSSDPGDLILDPFAGSGTTLRAAKDLGRKAIGIELEERYCEIAVKRLQQSVLPLEVS